MTAPEPYARAPSAPSGVLADGQVLLTAISSGSWVAGGLGAFVVAADDGPDPLAVLERAGLGWLVEYLEPLPGWLSDLTTDTAQVRAFSQDWADVARQLSSAAGQIDQAVTVDLVDAAGDAADAYRSLTGDVTAHVEGTATWAEGVSSGLQTAVTLQDAVRGAVRAALVRVVGSVLAEYGVGYGPGAGRSDAALVAYTTTVVAQAAQEVGGSVTALLGSLQRLGGLMEDLTGVLHRAQSLFDGVPALGRRAFHRDVGQSRPPLPDVADVPHPRDGGDVDTWASTVATRHGTLTTDEVTAVYQYTAADGPDTQPAGPGAGSAVVPGAQASVTQTLSELARLPLADRHTVHVAVLSEAATDSVRLGQQLPPVLLAADADGNARVHIDWQPRTDASGLSHYRDEGGWSGAYLEVVGRQWNPAERCWEIFAREP